MNCSDIEKKWQQYLNGELTDEEEKQIEAHIKECPVCSNKLNQELKKTSREYLPGESLSEEKETRILKWSKWKNRFSPLWTFTGI